MTRTGCCLQQSWEQYIAWKWPWKGISFRNLASTGHLTWGHWRTTRPTLIRSQSFQLLRPSDCTQMQTLLRIWMEQLWFCSLCYLHLQTLLVYNLNLATVQILFKKSTFQPKSHKGILQGILLLWSWEIRHYGLYPLRYLGWIWTCSGFLSRNRMLNNTSKVHHVTRLSSNSPLINKPK